VYYCKRVVQRLAGGGGCTLYRRESGRRLRGERERDEEGEGGGPSGNAQRLTPDRLRSSVFLRMNGTTMSAMSEAKTAPNRMPYLWKRGERKVSDCAAEREQQAGERRRRRARRT